MGSDNPSWKVAGTYNHDSLAESMAQRFAMSEAKVNFAKYHELDFDDVTDQMVRHSSAGIYGWADAKIEDGHGANTVNLPGGRSIDNSGLGSPFGAGLLVSDMGLPLIIDDHRHGEKPNISISEDPWCVRWHVCVCALVCVCVYYVARLCI